MALSLSRYTWRHNRVLQHLAEATETAVEAARETRPAGNQALVFIKEGEKGWATSGRGRSPGILDMAQDWRLAMDLKSERCHYPQEIKETGQRPDIVVYSEEAGS